MQNHHSDSNSSTNSSHKKGFLFFRSMIKKLDLDCNDGDLEEEDMPQTFQDEEDIKSKTARNRLSTLENPFLSDFFVRLRNRSKSKKAWYNTKPN